MKTSCIRTKATACILAVLMFASVLLTAPVHTYALENSKQKASTTQIAKGSSVLIKKGALTADTLEEANAFLTAFDFEFEVIEEVKDGVATVKRTFNVGQIMDDYGLTMESIIKIFDLNVSTSPWLIMLGNVISVATKVIDIPVEKKFKVEDLILVKNGINSTREELKYIGKNAHIQKGAVDVNEKEINQVWCILEYKITTVVDTVAHLQCKLTPEYVQKMGITKDAFANLIGVDSSNGIYDVLYDTVMAANYTVNFDVDLKYLNIEGMTSVTDTETDTSRTTDTSTDTSSDIKKNTTIYGDADNNNSVDLEDVVLIQRYIASLARLTSAQRLAADVTGDKQVNLEDVTTIQRYIARIIKVFPVSSIVG